MGALFQPINQVKFTNVAVVKYKHKGKKFEIACYKNKIIDWRNGVELNIDDVLQSHLIFTNISKGEIAKKSELNSCFNSDDNYEICKTILEKGILQISNKERTILKEKLYKDMIEILHEMSVNPQTGYPLSTNMIESMVKNVGYSINLEDGAKKQALKVFDILSKEYDDVIQRAFMRIQIICDDFIKDDVIKFLNNNNAIIEEEKVTNDIKREDNININSSKNHTYVCNTVDEIGELESGINENIKKENENHSTKTESQLEVKQNVNEQNKNELNQHFLIDDMDSCINKNLSNGIGERDAGENCYNRSALINDRTDNTRKGYYGEQEKDAASENSIFSDNHCGDESGIHNNFFQGSEKEENDSLEKIGSLKGNHSEERKKNIQNNIFLNNSEKTANEPFSDESKVKTKQKKNKQDRERKERHVETYKIVFLCYPCIYRCVDDFTKKYKKNCSCKILSNNVKIATSNKNIRSEAERAPSQGEDGKRKNTSKNKNKAKDDRSNHTRSNKSGNKSGNQSNNDEAMDNRTDSHADSCARRENEPSRGGQGGSKKNDIFTEEKDSNNISNNVHNSDKYDKKKISESQEKIASEGNTKQNAGDVIMCTSCLMKIEKSNYKQHCRSDFHVYNVKRKYKKLPPISLEEYIEIDFDVSHFHVDM
ncbi:ribosome maturation protein SBDS, putative [Plasmodium ovale wallikeri]|uniref:Ribosome maturation protein SBDS, putative n=1 Tax=Plasmodium ovale wallikeri TaxID=864142 RepID=A0A1A8ZQH0_PLAOA|nr:ribosome maturation protein SBDS, putative [Plasmodium ovale wallikeri]SBT46672.1 ribosome maturation protein SBDS, putative [Plasmodium ovale wallikeri]